MHISDSSRMTRQRGFTLVELMVTVAVLSILMAIAVPSMRRIILSNTLTASGNELVTAAQLARMEAVRRRATVDICPSTNGTSCSGADWKHFIVVTRAGEVIRDVELKPGSYTLTSTFSDNKLSYSASGLAKMGNAPVDANGSFRSCTTKLSSDNRLAVEVGVSRVSTSWSTVTSC